MGTVIFQCYVGIRKVEIVSRDKTIGIRKVEIVSRDKIKVEITHLILL